MAKPIIALMYDFDRTLAIEDMQNFQLIPKLGYTPKEFWERTEAFCKKYDMDKILGYLYMILEVAKERNIPLTKEFLAECGKPIKFFEGVTTWFNRINKYAEEKGMVCEHYLITSGNSEIVKGSSIFKEFTKVFGCKYLYDDKGEAYWPRTIVNYTLKTQYIFRISKGVINDNDDKEINQKTINRRISYQNMIYMGDGLTDVPCMILVKQQGGASIAVYEKDQLEKVYNLLEDGRVDYICKADYSANSQLEKVVKLLIDGMAIRESLKVKRAKSEKAL
jgi:hypothetical protein